MAVYGSTECRLASVDLLPPENRDNTKATTAMAGGTNMLTSADLLPQKTRNNTWGSDTSAFPIFNEMLEHKGAGTRAFVGQVGTLTDGVKLSLALTHRDVPGNVIVGGYVYTEVTTPTEAIQSAMHIVCASHITGWEIEVFLPKRILKVECNKYVTFTVKRVFPDDLSATVSASVFTGAIDDKMWRTVNLVQPVMKVAASDTDEEAADIIKRMHQKWDNLMNPKPYTDKVPKANNFESGLASVDWIYFSRDNEAIISADPIKVKADGDKVKADGDKDKAEGDKDKAEGDNDEDEGDDDEDEVVWSRTHKLLAFLGSSLNFNTFFKWLRNSPELIESGDLPTTANDVLEERIRMGGDVAMQAHEELLRRTTHQRTTNESLPTERTVGELEEKVATKEEKQEENEPVGFSGPEYYRLPPGCAGGIRSKNFLFSKDGTLLEAN